MRDRRELGSTRTQTSLAMGGDSFPLRAYWTWIILSNQTVRPEIMKIKAYFFKNFKHIVRVIKAYSSYFRIFMFKIQAVLLIFLWRLFLLDGRHGEDTVLQIIVVCM